MWIVFAILVILAVVVYRLRLQLQQQLKRVQSLEARLKAMESKAVQDVPQALQPVAREPVRSSSVAPPPAPRPASPAPGPDAWSAPVPVNQTPSYFDLALRWMRRWLTTGNVPVKVGVLVSFFGVSFLLKYAAEQNYLMLPIELRLFAVGAVAAGALAFGWHQRDRRPAFALSLQGGAIGVLFLTVFAAFQIFQLLPAIVAFALLVLFTVVAGVLAVLQNALALAVLGVVGGFLAPVLISTGAGSHVTLFSYYAVLNGAVFGLAWLRPWRMLNLIGFVFTFVIGAAWGYQFYQPEHFASVQPFLVLFFFMYLGISMAYALGRSIRLRSYVDSALVFGLPFVVFPLQSQLVAGFEHGLASSALALAAIYLVAATVLLRSRLRDRVGLLGESFLALGIGFATLAVPLVLSAHWTALTWALEGTVMVWVGTRQNRQLPAAAGAALQGLAGLAFVYSLIVFGRTGDGLFLNDQVLGGVVLALSGLASARWLEARSEWFRKAAPVVSWLLFGWGLLWWFSTLMFDLVRVLSPAWLPASWLVLLAGTAAALRLLQIRLHWRKVQGLLSGYLPLVLLTAVVWLDFRYPTHFLAFGGWFAWPLVVLTLAFLFRGELGLLEITRPWQRAMTVWLLALLLLRETYWIAGVLLPEGVWRYGFMLVMAAALHAVIWQLWRTKQFAVDRHSRDWSLRGVGPVLALGMAASLVWLLNSSGDPAPLFYLPLLNPLALATIAVAVATVHWARVNRLPGGEWVLIGLSAFAFVLITSEVTRTVHHWSGVPFRVDALFESVRVQASLSVVWALSALAVMVFGHRRAQRIPYLCGAGLMALVVSKLFLVDLAQSETLERIVSFIGVGLLLLVVGFLAPVPPKQERTMPSSP
ncbi:DUF2339 domain-containing protein [Marinimicrobium alkaliphilum]|uniref:DUF2339 domain-containing protein n=1 Tax=Marinimicrobium alkaliphilum TaxID=2202654 RepID=UPI000DB976CB|nr:DUF2339 domain-containing protein [Marinimicrobium alkaliphilum]